VNVPPAEVTLAALEQHHAAVLGRHPRGGEQARDGGLLVVIGRPHPHHLGQPPHVAADAPGGEGGVKGGPRGTGLASRAKRSASSDSQYGMRANAAHPS